MDEQIILEPEQEIAPETQPYKPRPRSQIIAAWIGVAVMVLAFLSYCWQIAFGAP